MGGFGFTLQFAKFLDFNAVKRGMFLMWHW